MNLSEHEFPEGYFPKDKVKEFIRRERRLFLSLFFTKLSFEDRKEFLIERDALVGEELI